MKWIGSLLNMLIYAMVFYVGSWFPCDDGNLTTLYVVFILLLIAFVLKMINDMKMFEMNSLLMKIESAKDIKRLDNISNTISIKFLMLQNLIKEKKRNF